MARPIDLTSDNTPIQPNYDGNAGKGNCACGGKGCKSKSADLLNTPAKRRQPFIMLIVILLLAALVSFFLAKKEDVTGAPPVVHAEAK